MIVSVWHVFRTIGGPVIQDVGIDIDLSCHDACYPAVIGRASTVWQGYPVTGRFGLDAMFSSACCIWRQPVISPETRQTACFGMQYYSICACQSTKLLHESASMMWRACFLQPSFATPVVAKNCPAAKSLRYFLRFECVLSTLKICNKCWRMRQLDAFAFVWACKLERASTWFVKIMRYQALVADCLFSINIRIGLAKPN